MEVGISGRRFNGEARRRFSVVVIIDLRTLEAAGEIDVDGLGLCVKVVDLPAALAVDSVISVSPLGFNYVLFPILVYRNLNEK